MVILVSRVGIRRQDKVSLCASVIRTAISQAHPMLVTTAAAVFNVIPLLFSITFKKVTIAVVFKLAFTAKLALFIAPTLCSVFCGMGKG